MLGGEKCSVNIGKVTRVCWREGAEESMRAFRLRSIQRTAILTSRLHHGCQLPSRKDGALVEVGAPALLRGRLPLMASPFSMRQYSDAGALNADSRPLLGATGPSESASPS